MKKIINIIKTFSWFEWLMILAIIGFSTYFGLTDTENSPAYIIIDAVAAITGVFCVVLCAKGKKAQYVWGLFNILAYILIAWTSSYWGEVMLNSLYYLPSQFIGYFLWGKHTSKKTHSVQAKKLSIKQIVCLVAICGIAVFLYKLVLDALSGSTTLLDSASTIISVFANLLMLMRYREQWLLWIVIDIITVAMWVIMYDPIMIAMWSVYLVNAFYGFITWTKLAKKEVKNA